MRIVCVGGGPAGLYFALVMKRRHPEHDAVVDRLPVDLPFPLPPSSAKTGPSEPVLVAASAASWCARPVRGSAASARTAKAQ